MEGLEIEDEPRYLLDYSDQRRSLGFDDANLSLDPGSHRYPVSYGGAFQKSQDEDSLRDSLGLFRNDRPQKAMSIAESVQKCVGAFQILRQSAKYPRLPYTSRSSGQEYMDGVAESLERFDIWTRDVGAHERDINSLDTRLHEASHLRRTVLGYLHDIWEGISDIVVIMEGTRTPWDKIFEYSSDNYEAITYNADDKNTELKQLLEYLQHAIGCLHRLSTIIQKPAPHDRFIKTGLFNQSYHQKRDEQHVRDKFKSLPEWLIKRLGIANSRRRQFLANRKDHHDRIAELRASNADEETKTGVSSLPTIPGQMDDLNVLNRLDQHSAVELDEGRSVTSYAETLATVDGTLLVPEMPANAQEGAPFECPLCFEIVDGIHKRSQWKRHVFSDLQPYVCISENCIMANETYARRHKWIEHDRNAHRTTFRCIFGCDRDFENRTDAQKHVRENHQELQLADDQLDAFVASHRNKISGMVSCPLCHDSIDSLEIYYKHVARHLEQLALSVISNDVLEDTDEAADVDDVDIGGDADSSENESEENQSQYF